MISLQLIALALLILTYGSYSHAGPLPGSPVVILTTVLASHAALVLGVWARARRAQRQLHQRSVDAYAVSYSMERTLSAARWATVALAGWQLWELGWGKMVWHAAGWNLGRYPLLAELVVFLPPFFSWIGFWAAHYPVDQAIRERAFPYRLQMGLPVHEMPGFLPYLSMQIRHGFFLVVPLAAGKLAEHVADSYEGWRSYAVSGALLAAMLVAVPWIVTRIWRTTPMAGTLRTRLVNLAGRHRVGFRDVLIWRTHHQVNNAAVLGYLPFSRYFLMTDSLLETLTDRQIEAVFAHEVGHAKHRHLWWYIAIFAAGGGLTVWASSEVLQAAQHWGVPMAPDSRDLWDGILQLVLLGLFLMFGFSWVSRRFEHQADWFATRHMAASLEEEAEGAPEEGRTIVEHYLQESTVETGDFASPVTPALLAHGLTPVRPLHEAAGGTSGETGVLVAGSRGTHELQRGAELFASALETLVRMSHRSLSRGGWLHPSPRRRAALLYRLARSPEAVRQFERQMFWTRAMIAGMVILALAVIPSLAQQ